MAVKGAYGGRVNRRKSCNKKLLKIARTCQLATTVVRPSDGETCVPHVRLRHSVSSRQNTDRLTQTSRAHQVTLSFLTSLLKTNTLYDNNNNISIRLYVI